MSSDFCEQCLLIVLCEARLDFLTVPLIHLGPNVDSGNTGMYMFPSDIPKYGKKRPICDALMLSFGWSLEIVYYAKMI